MKTLILKKKFKDRIAVIGLKGLPAFGGAAAVGENLINHLKEQYDFTVYATASHTEKKVYKNGFHQVIFRALPFKGLNTLYYYIISALHAVVYGNYDLVHLHHRDAAFIILILRLRYKVVLTTHGSFGITDKWKKFNFFFSLQEKYFVKYANIITCVSKNEQRLYTQKYNLKPIYIPNGIHKDSYPADLNERCFGNDGYIFFSAGRIMQTKGCQIMLQALNMIDYKGKILIAGDLEQTSECKKEVLSLSKNLNVDFLGFIKNRHLLSELIKKAKIFIFPSSREAMSMMLLEVASMRTPIIASDITENKDIFNEDEVLFFRTDNPKDLADKICWARNNYDIMLIKSENAYKKLASKYLWITIAIQYKNIFRKLMVNSCV